MKTNEALMKLRKNQGLTQTEVAEKVFVTRQAVSRWETGETTPDIDTLKLLSTLFNVSINQLLGQPQGFICQSCAMPLQEPEDLGTESDGGVTSEYCAHCYQEGTFTHDRSIDEMLESNLKFLHEFNKKQGTEFSEDEARVVLRQHLAALTRWKKLDTQLPS